MSFDSSQLKQIELGIQQGLDISWYAKECFNAIQMDMIRCGLVFGLDVSLYANPELDWKEVFDIFYDLLEEKNNVD